MNAEGRRTRIEKVTDVLLFFVITLPALSLFVTEPFCGGWNEGSMQGSCSLPVLESLYNTVYGLLLMAAFTGFITLPLILVLGLMNLGAKLQRFRAGYRPAGIREVLKEALFALPLFSFAALLILFLYAIATSIGA